MRYVCVVWCVSQRDEQRHDDTENGMFLQPTPVQWIQRVALNGLREEFVAILVYEDFGCDVARFDV